MGNSAESIRDRPAWRAPVVALALAILAHVLTRILAAGAEAEFPPRGAFVDAAGARVHYVEKGAGDPIVLVHGAFGTSTDFVATILDDVSARGRAIAVDRPGHVWSARPDELAGTPAEQARDLHAALEKLAVERPILVGFSWSGALVMAYALEFPRDVAGVLVVNPVLYDWDGTASLVDTAAGLPILGPLLAHTLALPLGLATKDEALARAASPAAVTRSFASSPVALEIRPANLLANASDMRVLKASVRALAPRYREIAVPLAIVVGLEDRIASPTAHSQRVHAEVAGSLLFPIEGGGHQVLYTHPSAVVAALDALRSRIAENGTRRAR